MPKEITHWIAAEKLRGKLEGTPWARAIEANPSCLDLGAVAHDALYFLPATYPEKVKRVPHILAGHNGEDTYDVIRVLTGNIIEQGGGAENAHLCAWLAGLASHIHLDAAFHPLVFHHTGNYHHENTRDRSRAVQRHRAMETLMDIHLAGGLKEVMTYSLQGMLNSRLVALKRLFSECGFAEVGGVSRSQTVEAMTAAFKVYASVQGMSLKLFNAKMIYRLRRMLPRGLKELGALFYIPQMRKQLPRLEGEIPYLHPATGEEHAHSLNELLETAVDQTADLLLRLQPMVFEGSEFRLPERGPAMDGAPKDELRYFADNPLIEF
ncbi:zinc dependent phospholipase C family protein [Desulfohalovibrio reitneri]|uniref:zinc dependent phospholipase C family protein n=1 Tax=Desulfohalovibrio reitneri TaxID=1307759 RepID=UPI0004A72080|nr:zinc dependent phospholipase C family protein [Desulfohalovibrio reitneri]